MTTASTGPSSKPSLGEVLHRVRQAARAGRPRPWPPEEWADRLPELQALDEAMAAAVATAERDRIIALLQAQADREREAADAFPADPGLTGAARAAENAVRIAKGDAGGEGLMP